MTDEERRDVRVGDEVVFSLAANPTTGFDWKVEFPPELLKFEGREHRRSSDLIGAGGTTTITLRALTPGEAEVRLEYVRVWEGRPAEERRIRVRIAPRA